MAAPREDTRRDGASSSQETGVEALPLSVFASALQQLDVVDLARLQAVSRGLCCLAQVRGRIALVEISHYWVT
jgi:hypothetical protein